MMVVYMYIIVVLKCSHHVLSEEFTNYSVEFAKKKIVTLQLATDIYCV